MNLFQNAPIPATTKEKRIERFATPCRLDHEKRAELNQESIIDERTHTQNHGAASKSVELGAQPSLQSGATSNVGHFQAKIAHK